MEKHAIAFTLEYKEAIEMDEKFTSAKSFKKQFETLITLSQENTAEVLFQDKFLYYVSMVVNSFLDSKDYETLEKYINGLLKENVSLSLKRLFKDLLVGNEHHLASYEALRKQVDNATDI